jgi:hypothetical protein
MNNVTFETINNVEYAIIDRGNGEFTSMTKETYDTVPSNFADPVEAEKPKK